MAFREIILLLSLTYAYEVVTSVYECKQCFNSGRDSCWRKKIDYTGYYTQSYCCSPNDYICNSLNICSNEVTDERLKLFTCPVSSYSCPRGYQAELHSTSVGTSKQYIQKFTSYKIRQETYCKLHITHLGPYATEKYKYNNQNIYVETLSEMNLFLVSLTGSSYASATIEELTIG